MRAIRLKTHGEGAHDYPPFIADWSKLLTDKGALVDGSFHFPTAQEHSAGCPASGQAVRYS